MSSSARRREKQALFEQEMEARLQTEARERARKAALSAWERIEELSLDEDTKEFLHELAKHCGLEE